MTTTQNFFFANGHYQRAIQLKRDNRSSTSRRQTDDTESLPSKVIGPALAPGMVQGDAALRQWVNGGTPSLLPQ